MKDQQTESARAESCEQGHEPAGGQSPRGGQNPADPESAWRADAYRELFEKLGWGFAHHRMVFDSQGEPVDYVTLDVNKTFEDLLRAPREGVIGKPASEILPGPELARWLRLFGAVVRTGKPATYELFSPHNQKRFRGHAYAHDLGTFSVAFEDVTERFRDHQLLAASEEKYRTLVETAEDAIVLADLQGRHLFRNSAYYTSLGYSPGETIRPDGYGHIHPDDLPVVQQARESLLVQGWQRLEYRVQHRDGHWIWRSSRSTLVRDASGQPYAFLAILRDITDQKRAEEERDRLQSQLLHAQKLEVLGVLSSGIAHDFNNILATIQCGVELATLKADELAPVQNEGMRMELDSIRQAAQRATSLVKQILSLSRKGSEAKQPLLLVTLIKEACKFLRSALPATIEIQSNLSDDGPVQANPTQIHQVIMNLLTNAGLAMPNGGKIEIGLSRTSLGEGLRSRHPSLPDEPYARITIRDTGCGIAPENIGRVFEPFFTTREEGTGTGLGLAVVQSVVEAHGGAVEVTSEPGKGATFEVFLPISEHQSLPPRPDPATSARQRAHPLGRGRRTFPADDAQGLGGARLLGIGLPERRRGPARLSRRPEFLRPRHHRSHHAGADRRRSGQRTAPDSPLDSHHVAHRHGGNDDGGTSPCGGRRRIPVEAGQPVAADRAFARGPGP